MRTIRWMAILGFTLILPVRAEWTALDRYVRAPDPAYGYRLVKTLPGDDYTAYVLEMTSQNWLDPDRVDRTLWRHWLTIVRPQRVTSRVALLSIGSGDNDEPPPDEAHPRVLGIARATGSVAALLRQVPNQPLRFTGDQAGPRDEDALIAYAWDRYLRSGDPHWLPRLPMTKSVVRAMDTITAFAATPAGGELEIERFVVFGASKRGWTTWTTAAVDERVVAIVPMVIDLLNLEESFEHHYRAYGFWAPAVHDYVEIGIPQWIGTPEMRALREIVEPYEYRSRLALPKLLINAAGDQFFLPDSSRFYFAELPGEKHLRYVPNADHSLRDTDAADSLLAFYRAILNDTPRPEFSWTFVGDDAIAVRLEGAQRPSQVLLWQAGNPKTRDFRVETIGRTWTSTALEPESDGRYLARVTKPEQGWTAFFVELSYPGNGPPPLKLTTEVRVVPDVLPFRLEPITAEPPAAAAPSRR